MAAIPSMLNANLSFHYLPKIEVKAGHHWQLNCSFKSQDSGNSRNSGSSNRRVWRRRKLTVKLLKVLHLNLNLLCGRCYIPEKKDDNLDYKMERVPFLEEQVRKIRGTGKLLTGDIERLLLSEDNRFDFVNEVAAEAKMYVENNRDDYGSKKAILHVISNRMNDAGIYRPEGHMEDDPFKPGPGYLKDEL